jgi:uncharacterized membrane protein required for colicin V production
MINMIAGFVLGFFVATMGVSGVAHAIDNMIDKIKTTTISVETK